MLQRVAIFSKDNNAKTREAVRKLVDEFLSHTVHVQVFQTASDPETINDKSVESFSDLRSLSSLPEMVLSVGGDGTFLETVLQVKDMGIPIAGVNTGRMGFLANISADEISKSVDLLCKSEYEIIERCLLQISHPQEIFDGNPSLALNEITIQKADLSMITISVFIDETHLNTYWACLLYTSPSP